MEMTRGHLPSPPLSQTAATRPRALSTLHLLTPYEQLGDMGIIAPTSQRRKSKPERLTILNSVLNGGPGVRPRPSSALCPPHCLPKPAAHWLQHPPPPAGPGPCSGIDGLPTPSSKPRSFLEDHCALERDEGEGLAGPITCYHFTA